MYRVVYKEHASRILTELQAEEAAWRAANRSARRSDERPIGGAVTKGPPGGGHKVSGRPRRDRVAACVLLSVRND
jgi:hypothetical protein